MNKILSPLLLLLLVIIAYQSFEFQSASSKRLEESLLKERAERGQYYCQRIAYEIEFLPNIDATFLKFLDQIVNIQPNEIIQIDLKNGKDFLPLWKHPLLETNTASNKNN